MYRGVGRGETGEALASLEIRGCLKSNIQIGKKKNTSGILFFGASPEIILFLRPWAFGIQSLESIIDNNCSSKSISKTFSTIFIKIFVKIKEQEF